MLHQLQLFRQLKVQHQHLQLQFKAQILQPKHKANLLMTANHLMLIQKIDPTMIPTQTILKDILVEALTTLMINLTVKDVHKTAILMRKVIPMLKVIEALMIVTNRNTTIVWHS